MRSTGTVAVNSIGRPPQRSQNGSTSVCAEVKPPQPSHEPPLEALPQVEHVPAT